MNALKARWFQPTLMLLSFAAFTVLIIAGFIGTPAGSRNTALVFVWILWFFLLVMLLIPLGGRLWCLICPIPAPADWLTRRAFIAKNGEPRSLGVKWPKKLENTWLQTMTFLIVAALSPVLLFYPPATSMALLTFVLLSIALGLIFNSRGRGGRIFCRYVCPLGGFIGVYSHLGALKIRPNNPGVCKKCRLKACVKGNDRGYGCPWFNYPGGLGRNAFCGLCTECIKTCTHDNMALKIGRPGKVPGHYRIDEAFLSLTLLGSAIFYSAAFFGWFPMLKGLSSFIEGPTIGYPLRFDRLLGFSMLLLGTILLLTLLYLLGVVLGKKLSRVEKSIGELFTGYSYSLVPLGLAAWMGFMAYETAFNGAYIIPAVSDPLGWGWNLFGTAQYSWRPYMPTVLPYIQVTIFLVGAAMATKSAWSVSLKNFSDTQRVALATLPTAFFTFAVTSGLIYLYIVP